MYLFNIHDITLFSNVSYLTFLCIVVPVYYLLKRSLVFLTLASIFFYATFSIQYCLLFFALCLINYALGRVLSKFPKKSILFLGVILSLSPLIIFRYTNFILENINPLNLLGYANITISILQPLGISFFTFELLHYLIDVYKGKPAIKNIAKFFLFPFFFPTQIAGPIKRYENFIPQLKRKEIDWVKIQTGLLLIIRGLFKKLVLANTLAPIASVGFDTSANSWVTLVAVYAFAFQIFFDFSGYTDIGRGSANLLGFDIPENFLLPYLATSMRDFWRRWHITLMKWLTDYIYIPLGGNRVNRMRWVVNILIVFVLSGFWHGAAWHFAFWGLYNGILVLLSNLFHPLQMIPFKKIRFVLSVFFTFHLVLIGWIFFRAKDMATASGIFKVIENFNTLSIQISESVLFVLFLLTLYLLYKIIMTTLSKRNKKFVYFRYLSYGIAIVFIILHMTNQVQFIYFQF